MKSKLALLAVAAMIATPVAMPTAASAEGHYKNGRYYKDGRTYYGRGGHYRYRCKKSSGTTGALVGGAGGALAGNALGGGVLGTVAGGVGGALLGKHLDKRHDSAQNRRNGC